MLAPFQQNLLGCEVGEQFFYIVVRALPHEELARRDIQEGYATGPFTEVDSREEVVLLIVKHIVAHCHTGCDQFRDAPFHQFLRELRIFQLVADGHASARPDEFGQIGIERMIGESGHSVLALVARPVVAVSQRDTQYPACVDGIVAVGLVEVATSEEQQCVGVFLFE